MIEFKTTQNQLFTTPIWESMLTGIDNQSIKQYALGLRNKYPGANISNRGGWHSDIQKPDGVFEPLVKEIQAICTNINLDI